MLPGCSAYCAFVFCCAITACKCSDFIFGLLCLFLITRDRSSTVFSHTAVCFVCNPLHCMHQCVARRMSSTATLPSPLPLSRVGSGAILLHRVNRSRQAGLAPASSMGRVQHSTLSASCYNIITVVNVLLCCLCTCGFLCVGVCCMLVLGSVAALGWSPAPVCYRRYIQDLCLPGSCIAAAAAACHHKVWG